MKDGAHVNRLLEMKATCSHDGGDKVYGATTLLRVCCAFAGLAERSSGEGRRR